MNYLLGLSTGLCLGTSLYLAVFSMQRRRKLALMGQLFQRGTYRVLDAEGSSVTASELFQAIEGAAALNDAQPRKGKLAAVVAVGFAAAVIISALVVLTAR
jgi:hypothetical protein